MRTRRTTLRRGSEASETGTDANRCRSLRKSPTASNWRRAKATRKSAIVEDSPVLSRREMVAVGTPLRRASSPCVQLTRWRFVRSQPPSCANPLRLHPRRNCRAPRRMRRRLIAAHLTRSRKCASKTGTVAPNTRSVALPVAAIPPRSRTCASASRRVAQSTRHIAPKTRRGAQSTRHVAPKTRRGAQSTRHVASKTRKVAPTTRKCASALRRVA